MICFVVGWFIVCGRYNASSYLCDLGTEVCYNIIYEQNYGYDFFFSNTNDIYVHLLDNNYYGK